MYVSRRPAGLSPTVGRMASRRRSQPAFLREYFPPPYFTPPSKTHCLSLLHSILWPFAGDQPHNAVHVSENLKIGYELLEVRTGHGLKPILRKGYTPIGTVEAVKKEAREVLSNAFGEDGAQKRERLQVLQKAVNQEWKEGGGALRDTILFLDSI